MFPSVTAAVAATETTRSAISKCVHGTYALKSTGGFVWKHLENALGLEAVREKRRVLEEELMRLKRVEHDEITRDLPLPYMAGFVDADGCLQASVHSSHAHSICQKYPAICNAFKRQYGGGITCCKDTGIYHWHTHVATARQFLLDISPFLVEKAEQARLLLGMNRGDGPEVRLAISQINGRQKEKAFRAMQAREGAESSETKLGKPKEKSVLTM